MFLSTHRVNEASTDPHIYGKIYASNTKSCILRIIVTLFFSLPSKPSVNQCGLLFVFYNVGFSGIFLVMVCLEAFEAWE